MRVLVATDAWHPQVNGVVRTLTSLARSVGDLGASIEFLTPEGFPSVPVPTYPGLRVALPGRREIARRIGRVAPDAIHVATEGPIGYAARAYCLRHGLPFTTSYTTRFPEYINARFPVPLSWSYAYLRRFHAAATVTMVSTPSLRADLGRRGFRNLGLWTRGVDTELFNPGRPAALGLPRPVFLSVGRVAVEKNLEAFLNLDLPGSKVVVGDGPHEAELRRRFPAAHFLGRREGEALASVMAAADVFVFPSLTDTFGVVQLEALACGVPVAAYPVTGPRDVIGDTRVGTLDEDLRAACMASLGLSREECRAFARARSWDTSARQFIGHMERARAGSQAARAAWPGRGGGQVAGPRQVTGPRQLANPKAMEEAMVTDLKTEHVAEAYGRWAPVYDLVFGRVFEHGRRASIDAAERVGGRILEVGVGTGISLPDYAPGNRVFGIDISEGMLRKARSRVAELGLAHVEGLAVMDAERLEFPDDSFDVVVAQYVVTAVPNPEAALDEFARVVRPGGEIVLTSRVGADDGVRRALEHGFAPLARRLGWRTEFDWSRYTRWAERSRGIRIVERRAMPPLGHFSLIRFAKSEVDLVSTGAAGAQVTALRQPSVREPRGRLDVSTPNAAA